MTMSDKHNDVFFVCWIIERFSRVTGLSHKEIVEKMGREEIKHYLNYADVMHCENPDKIVGELAEEFGLPVPPLYGSVIDKSLPSLSDIGMVYYRIVRHAHPDDFVEGIYAVMSSFLPPLIADYGNNLYWANREYLVACYNEGCLL